MLSLSFWYSSLTLATLSAFVREFVLLRSALSVEELTFFMIRSRSFTWSFQEAVALCASLIPSDTRLLISAVSSNVRSRPPVSPSIFTSFPALMSLTSSLSCLPTSVIGASASILLSFRFNLARFNSDCTCFAMEVIPALLTCIPFPRLILPAILEICCAMEFLPAMSGATLTLTGVFGTMFFREFKNEALLASSTSIPTLTVIPFASACS